jgi:PIN domain nuclease of toxin-antitoxin system
MQIKSGRLKLSASLEHYVKQKFFARAISILDVETQDILRSHSLNFSQDPFDVLIVSMAPPAVCPLITADSIIHEAKPCPLFWD